MADNTEAGPGGGPPTAALSFDLDKYWPEVLRIFARYVSPEDLKYVKKAEVVVQDIATERRYPIMYKGHYFRIDPSDPSVVHLATSRKFGGYVTNGIIMGRSIMNEVSEGKHSELRHPAWVMKGNIERKLGQLASWWQRRSLEPADVTDNEEIVWRNVYLTIEDDKLKGRVVNTGDWVQIETFKDVERLVNEAGPIKKK